MTRACCTGNCRQGRDCPARQPLLTDLHRITLTELDNEIAPDASRTFSRPTPRQPFELPRAKSVFIAVVAFAFLAFGLWIYPH